MRSRPRERASGIRSFLGNQRFMVRGCIGAEEQVGIVVRIAIERISVDGQRTIEPAESAGVIVRDAAAHAELPNGRHVSWSPKLPVFDLHARRASITPIIDAQ